MIVHLASVPNVVSAGGVHVTVGELVQRLPLEPGVGPQSFTAFAVAQELQLWPKLLMLV